jgi:phosphoenolpyruvate carboxykinase (ATP)
MAEHNVNVWLINTGWNGGEYGVGKRMNIPYTRAMITAALNGDLNNVEYTNLPIFNLAVPKTCPNVPDRVLNPTWDDAAAYNEKARGLAAKFNDNFKKYSDQADAETLAAAPEA